MRSLWLKAALALAAIWLAVAGAIWFARSAKPTPQSLVQYIAEHPMNSAPNRGHVIEKVARELNQLSYDDRKEVRIGRKLDPFFRSLNPDEQARFLDLTLPTGFKQMMEAFNKMDPAKRKEWVDKALADMKSHEGEQTPENNDPNVQKIIQEGLRSFYSDASASVKMDFSPLIEQMQKNMQSVR